MKTLGGRARDRVGVESHFKGVVPLLYIRAVLIRGERCRQKRQGPRAKHQLPLLGRVTISYSGSGYSRNRDEMSQKVSPQH